MTNVLTYAQRVDGNQHRTGIWDLDIANTQKVATTGATTAFAADTVVRVVCDADSHVNKGAAGTADTSDAFFPDNHVEYVFVRAGEQLAVVGGNMYVTPVK